MKRWKRKLPEERKMTLITAVHSATASVNQECVNQYQPTPKAIGSSAELPQLWNGRGRSCVQAEPLLVDKAEIATGLGSLGPEPHSSCTFQGVHPIDLQREKRFLCPTAPASLWGCSWVSWGIDSAMICEKESSLQSSNLSLPNEFLLSLSKASLGHCQKTPALAFVKLRYCYP